MNGTTAANANKSKKVVPPSPEVEVEKMTPDTLKESERQIFDEGRKLLAESMTINDTVASAEKIAADRGAALDPDLANEAKTITDEAEKVRKEVGERMQELNYRAISPEDPPEKQLHELNQVWDKLVGEITGEWEETKKKKRTPVSEADMKIYKKLLKAGGRVSKLNADERERYLAMEESYGYTEPEYEEMQKGEMPWKLNAVFRRTTEIKMGRKVRTLGTEPKKPPAQTKVAAAVAAGAAVLVAAAAAEAAATEPQEPRAEAKTIVEETTIEEKEKEITAAKEIVDRVQQLTETRLGSYVRIIYTDVRSKGYEFGEATETFNTLLTELNANPKEYLNRADENGLTAEEKKLVAAHCLNEYAAVERNYLEKLKDILEREERIAIKELTQKVENQAVKPSPAPAPEKSAAKSTPAAPITEVETIPAPPPISEIPVLSPKPKVKPPPPPPSRKKIKTIDITLTDEFVDPADVQGLILEKTGIHINAVTNEEEAAKIITALQGYEEKIKSIPDLLKNLKGGIKNKKKKELERQYLAELKKKIK